MPGLFGPEAQNGGPGSIWRIDGASGEVRLFTNVTLDGAPNSGAALGGLAFDPTSNSLFVADRETGMIHRFDLTGAERGRYDHGTQGRQSAGLAPLPFDQALRLNIASPTFQSANPKTWGYAPPSRRTFGLAVRDGRLYYSVAEGLQVWSVAIAPDGTFGTDARLEITVSPGQSASEISKIIFNDQGRMLLAERVAPSGAFDFAALTETGGGRVLRFEPSGGTTTQRWQPVVGDPETGLDASHGGNGGLAIGYGYDAAGRRSSASCGGTLWWTGEQLSPGGADSVNGLRGQSEGAVAGWLIDFDDQLDDPQSRGHVGDVAILRICAAAVAEGGPPVAGAPPAPGEPGFPTEPVPPLMGGPELGELLLEMWPDWPPPPPPVCPPGTHPENKGVQCCPFGQIPSVSGACTSACGNGDPDPAHQAACYAGFQPPGPHPGPGATYGTCWNGAPAAHLADAACAPGALLEYTQACNKCPKAPLKQCPSGFNLVTGGGPPHLDWPWSNAHCEPINPGVVCLAGQQKNMDGACQNLCPAGQAAYPVNRCCVNGTHVNALGVCPGVVAPPQWYLDYLATGTGPCLLPSGNCSYYEFTITGRQRFGRGSLTQRITLPEGSNFPEARITRGSKYCPPSAWSCSKSGNELTCSAEDCGLAPGDQVVLHLEGRVVPELREPPPTTIEKTACGELEWQALSGPGPAVIEQPDQSRKALTPQQREQGGTAEQLGGIPSKRTCWTIQVVGKQPTPSCAPNYLPTADGRCCLSSQLTADGVCCPANQLPDARRRTCVPVTPPALIGVPGIIVAPPPEQPCPPRRHWDGRQCVPDVVPCPPRRHWDGRQCVPDVVPCPPRHHWDGRRCVPDVVPCPPRHHWDGRQCMPDVVVGCPPGQHRVGRRCVPDVIACPLGQHRVGKRCVPDVQERICPPGQHRVGKRCVPDVQQRVCPPGQHRVGARCVPSVQERACPPGQHRVGSRCVSSQPELKRAR
jgi:hypothetical protein